MSETPWYGPDDSGSASSEFEEPAPPPAPIAPAPPPPRERSPSPKRTTAPPAKGTLLAHFGAKKAVPPDLDITFEAQFLKTLIKILQNFQTDANFHFTPTGINTRFLDNAHVILFEIHLNAAQFPYTFQCPKALCMGLDLKVLSSLLDRVEKDDLVQLFYAPGQRAISPVLTLHIHTRPTTEAQQQKKKKPGDVSLERSATYRIHEKNIETDEVGANLIVDPARLILPSTDFFQIVRKLAGVGDVVELTLGPDSLRFAVNGDEVGGAEFVITQHRRDGMLQNCEFACTPEQRCTEHFSLQYLDQLAPIVKIAPRMELLMKAESMLHLRFLLELGSLDFYLAGRIKE